LISMISMILMLTLALIRDKERHITHAPKSENKMQDAPSTANDKGRTRSNETSKASHLGIGEIGDACTGMTDEDDLRLLGIASYHFHATRRLHVRTRAPLAGWVAGFACLPDKSALGRWEPDGDGGGAGAEPKPRSAREAKGDQVRGQRKSEGGGGGGNSTAAKLEVRARTGYGRVGENESERKEG
jgi:hypothetical protein